MFDEQRGNEEKEGFLEELFRVALAAPCCWAICDSDCIIKREV